MNILPETKPQLIKELKGFHDSIYHLKCTTCGKTIAIYCKGNGLEDSEIKKALKKRLIVSAKRIYLEGLCQRCEVLKLKRKIAGLKSLRVANVRDIASPKSLCITDVPRNKEKYTTIFDLLEDPVFIIDFKGTILYVNSAALKRLGYLHEELLGQSVLKIHPSNMRREVLVIMDNIVKDKIDFCPLPLLTKDGRYIPVNTKVLKSRWNQKDIVFGICREAPAQKPKFNHINLEDS